MVEKCLSHTWVDPGSLCEGCRYTSLSLADLCPAVPQLQRLLSQHPSYQKRKCACGMPAGKARWAACLWCILVASTAESDCHLSLWCHQSDLAGSHGLAEMAYCSTWALHLCQVHNAQVSGQAVTVWHWLWVSWSTGSSFRAFLILTLHWPTPRPWRPQTKLLQPLKSWDSILEALLTGFMALMRCLRAQSCCVARGRSTLPPVICSTHGMA